MRHRKLLYSDSLSNDSLSVLHQPMNPAGGPGAFPPNPYVSLQLLATLCTWFDKDQIGLIESNQLSMLNRSAAVEIQSRRFLHSRLCLQNKTSTQQQIHIGARALGQCSKATGGGKVVSDKMRQEKKAHPLGCTRRLKGVKQMIKTSTLQNSRSEFNKYLKASSNLKSSRFRRMTLLAIDALLLLSL